MRFVRETIGSRGPVTFAWFMEQALYHPVHGYYSSGRCVIGRSGDYFTNVSVGPFFGRLMAAQFSEMWETLGRPAQFTIVEQGAHGGEFAGDVFAAARAHHPEFFAAAGYRIVEPFPFLRKRQLAALAAFGVKVTWHDSLADLPAFCGIHFSNELIDALPVHLVRWSGTEWMERHVDAQGTGFVWVDLPSPDDSAIAKRLDSVATSQLPVGYETEVNLAATEWIAGVATKLHDGFVVAVDYGWPCDEFYHASRATGTLRCYSQHRVVPSPLEQIGEVDITAHVEWTSLAEAAEQSGLTVLGFTDQHHFITALLAGPLRDESAVATSAATARQLQTLLHPHHLGMKFQYLLAAKGTAAAAAQLSGLKFARDWRKALQWPLDH